MPDETIMQAVSGVGFPIAVAFYLLTNFKKCIEDLTAATRENGETLREVAELMKRSTDTSEILAARLEAVTGETGYTPRHAA